MQHHSPASVAATAGVSVALRICPKKIGHPCHSNIRQITTFVLVHELAFGPGLLTPPVFIPFSVLFIICVLHNQNSLMIWEKRSSRQILPGDSVCPSSPSSEPSFSLPSVSEQKNGFFFYVLHMSNDFTWTKTLQTGLCHHAPCHYHLPRHISPTRTLQTAQELETPQLQASHLPSN